MDKLQKLDLGKPEIASVDATNLQELTPLVRAAIYVTVLDINDQLAITSSLKVQIVLLRLNLDMRLSAI